MEQCLGYAHAAGRFSLTMSWQGLESDIPSGEEMDRLLNLWQGNQTT
eukprot:CAMPEP_0115126262 /NCGR_PEP_ID=MMETSP0227-20121206/49614_1 /TAXON_ID=89957 /ORGANISM="Polarella glacialis, Strain CCMP 1383" /LENGTH=46 /DNA_ID= /DNA_START= /DNA_END= /DNA_ORIENTATION=